MAEAGGDIPTELASTFAMLSRAFPSGIDADDYRPLLGVLYDEMSHRQLADLIHHLTGKHQVEALNDVWGVGADPPVTPEIERIRQRLRPFGYEDWLREA